MPANMAGALSEREQRANQRAYAHLIQRALAPLPGRDLRVLELGSDCGWLLQELARLLPGRIASMAAVEPNGAVLPQLTAALAHCGVPASHFEHLDQALAADPHPLDAVIAIHVADHLFNSDGWLALLRSRLSSTGVIVIVVHNPQSLLARLLGRRWPPYCPQHPQLFTPRGLRALARRHGLALVRSGPTYNRFSLRLALGHFGLSGSPLDAVPFWAPLGNRYYILRPLPQ
jgi:hypothetical protein